MEQELNELYSPVILDHNQYPRHYQKRPEAGLILDAYNSLCGDKFKLYLDVQEDKVVEASFSGYGCAVSKAATSVLMEKIQGKSLEEVRNLVEGYFKVTKTDEELTTDEELLAFAAAKKFPGRLKCAVLSWEVLAEYLEEKI
jgi:nitrogen fixation protein NifU and related proteins